MKIEADEFESRKENRLQLMEVLFKVNIFLCGWNSKDTMYKDF